MNCNAIWEAYGTKTKRSQFVLDKELCDVSTAKSIRFISNNYETANSVDPQRVYLLVGSK